MSKAGRIGAILILTLGLLDLAAILFASQRSSAEPVRPERAVTEPAWTEPLPCPDQALPPQS
jgi:hypothetical protein